MEAIRAKGRSPLGWHRPSFRRRTLRRRGCPYSKMGTLLLPCFSFAGISFNQSMRFPICIDVARKFPGSMGGAMNMAAQVGSSLSGVVSGYIAKISGSYGRALIVMAFVLASGALVWLKINPEQELVPEESAELRKAWCPAPD